ncbi:MAG: proton-conducting transporter transmembrane domain-containing protein [Thermoplasmata archaeon]
MTFLVPLLGVSLGGFLAAVCVAWAGRGDRWTRASLALGSAASAVAAVQALGVLAGGTTGIVTLSVPGATAANPFLTFSLVEDPIAAFFLFVVAVSGSAILLASIGYTGRYVTEGRARLAGLINLFLLVLVLVCTAGTVFSFLVVWEGMTLLSYILVVHEHHSPETRRAGFLYLVMSQAGTAAILASFILLATGAGTGSFAGIARAANTLPIGLRDTAFLAALLGFGMKAGVVPLHIWLPEAHPAAPSNVSALLSGVMIKMGILGLIRVLFELLGGGPSWWAYLLLAVGALSALSGVLSALAEHDLKRLLAYHSIENIGIILMGVGASLLFLDLGDPALAALAMAAALLHTWNHALFKPLLFLGAGAAVGAVGTRNMEQMGGLARRMPAMGLGFLVGALAISGLPPFNGFVSEWLLFHSFFGGFTTGSVSTEMLFSALAGLLALTRGLAAYCFVKAFGIVFLGRPRSESASSATAPPSSMTAGMGVLAGLCVLLGVAPVLALDAMHRALFEITGASLGSGTSLAFSATLPSTGLSGPLPLAPGLIALLLAATLLIAWALWRMRGTPRPTVERPAWDCGGEATTARTEPTALGYAQPIEQLFHSYYRPKDRLELEPSAGAGRAGLAPLARFSREMAEPVRTFLYQPIATGILRVGRMTSRLQSGRIHAYLVYMFITLVSLLLLLRFVGGSSP